MSDLATQVRIALLGGDREKANSFVAEAQGRGVGIDYFESMQSMGFVGRFREYHAAIVHEKLEPLTGLELAEYIEKLFATLPVILLSDQWENESHGRPSSIIESFAPHAHASRVLARTLEAISLSPRPPLKLVES